MEAKVIVTYVVCDDTIKNLKIKDDSQAKMSMAEVMTTGVVSALLFGSNLENTRKYLKETGCIPKMLDKSQLNRRLHKITGEVWDAVLKSLSLEFSKQNINNEFIVDSCPIPTCKLARMNRSKLYSEKKYLGYCAAKDEFFVGLKLHMICDTKGNPVQFTLLPGSENDMKAFKKIELNLPKNSSIYADKAYVDYKYEDRLIQKKQIHLLPIRKKNSKRKGGGFLAKIRAKKRKMIETAFSCIEKLMPRSIHAVTKAGFELKSILFVLAYAVSKINF
jgi:hypothetical protein